MTLPEPPSGWGRDEITAFFDVARQNPYATFDNLPHEFQNLIAIDQAHRTLIDNLHQTPDWFAGLFVLRAHSSFLAAVRLATSGQIPEAYAITRSVIENGLYGFYIARHPDSGERWLRRHDSDMHQQAVRQEFRISQLIRFLESVDATEGVVARNLYDRSIDHGAHPNERALTQILGMKRSEGQAQLQIRYLAGDSPHFRLALRTTAQAGVCVLGVFRLIYRERFDLLGLTHELDALRQRL